MSSSAHDRISDELAIRNLLAELIWHADTTSLDGLDEYVRCFTPDAEWEMFGDVRKGHAAILDGARQRRTSGMMGPGTDVRHSMTATLVRFVEDDVAEAKSYIQAYRTASSDPTIFLMGEYHDTFRRTSEGWKMARRRVVFG